MNVEVTDIHISGRRYEWHTNWFSAYYQAREGDDFRDDIYGGTPVEMDESEEDLLEMNDNISDIDVY